MRQRWGWLIAVGDVRKCFTGRLKTLPCIFSMNAGAGGDAAGPTSSHPGRRRHPPALVRSQGHILRPSLRLPRVTSDVSAKQGQRHRALGLKQHSLQNPTSGVAGVERRVSWLRGAGAGRRREEISVLQHHPRPALKHLRGLTPLSKFMTIYFSFSGGSEPSHGSWVTLQRFSFALLILGAFLILPLF